MDSYRQSFLYVLQHNYHHHNRYPPPPHHHHHHDVIDELLRSPIYQYTHTRKLIKIVGINDDHSDDNHLQRHEDGHDPSYHTDDDDDDDGDDDDKD